MPFTFDPTADYYELFENCLADGTTEMLNDPEDFDEFVQALKDGRYDPETEEIAPAPLTEEQKEAIVKHIENCVAANNSWHSGHTAPTFLYVFTGKLSADAEELLTEFAIDVYDDVIGRSVSKEEYLDCAMTYIKREAERLLARTDLKEQRQVFEWGKQFIDQAGWDFSGMAVAFIERNPAWKAALWEELFNGDFVRDECWDEVFSELRYVYAFRHEITKNAEEIAEVLKENDYALPEDIECYGDVFVDCFVKAGVIEGEATNLTDADIQNLIDTERQEREAKIEEGKRKYLEQQAAIKRQQAEDAKARAEEKDGRSSSEIFFDALADVYFDQVFANADAYRALIEEHIEDIASNFCEGNEYEPVGNEPEWLMKLLLLNGAEVG